MFNYLESLEHLDYHNIVDRLIVDLETTDHYTSIHSARVGDMSHCLAELIGIKGDELERIHIAAHLHDIGKTLVPIQILNKSEKLLPYEWELIKKHSEFGYGILCKSDKLHILAEDVLHHHERWDGNGYPGKLKGKQIPLGSRIIAVCDTFDAMCSQRAYRQAFSTGEALQEIRRNSGKQFDPDLVDAAEELWPLIIELHQIPPGIN
ncbi:MAG: HD domain-containing protein [Bacillota bacterium]|nr:HD domain-containing protein [Bacillota bacterium]